MPMVPRALANSTAEACSGVTARVTVIFRLVALPRRSMALATALFEGLAPSASSLTASTRPRSSTVRVTTSRCELPVPCASTVASTSTSAPGNSETAGPLSRSVTVMARYPGWSWLAIASPEVWGARSESWICCPLRTATARMRPTAFAGRAACVAPSGAPVSKSDATRR